MLFAILLPFLCIGVSSAMGDEPKCSRFEFEKHLLEMLVRIEFELKQSNQKLALTEETLKVEIEELRQSSLNMPTELAASVLKEETMQMEIEELKQNDRNMTKELAASALTEDTLKKEIEELKQNDRNRATELAAFKDNSTQIIRNVTDMLTKEIEDSMEFKLTSLAYSASVPRIYFFGTSPGEATDNDRPIFRSVLHNEGDSYDPSTGLFTCRVPGLYHFAFGFTSKQDNFASCRIYRNDDQLVYSYAMGRYNSGSIGAYLHLDVGTTVDIRCSAYYWTWILKNNSMWYTGALIKK